MYENVCSFTGHRIIPPKEYEIIKEKTRKEIISLIEKNVNIFISGGALGFDTLCGNIVNELKKEYSHIRLFLALPCRSQDKYYNEKQKLEYKKLLAMSDRIKYISDNYYNGCMHKRNRYMVDHSMHLISYCTKNSGGTYYTVNYARELERDIIPIK